VLLTDRLKLEELLMNLVGNAIKFTKVGGVTVSAEKIQESLGVQTVEIRVKDTGIGISKNEQMSLFQPFSQANSTISSKFGGTGLGLSISKEIVESMRGTIQITSEKDIGTEMVLHIPFKIGDPQELSESPQSYSGTEMPEGERVKVLFCEDNRMLRNTFKKLLEKEGFDVTVCEDGEELLKVFPGDDWRVVVTDKHMPNMNGDAAAQILKDTHKDRHFRIILLTADINCAQSPSVDRVLVKPTNSQDLKTAILEEIRTLSKQKYALLT